MGESNTGVCAHTMGESNTDVSAYIIAISDSNTDVSAYTMYRHLQQYCSHPSYGFYSPSTNQSISGVTRKKLFTVEMAA